MKKGSLGFLVLFGSITLASVSAEVRAQGDGFYKGKTVRIMVVQQREDSMTVGLGCSPNTCRNISRGSRRS